MPERGYKEEKPEQRKDPQSWITRGAAGKRRRDGRLRNAGDRTPTQMMKRFAAGRTNRSRTSGTGTVKDAPDAPLGPEVAVVCRGWPTE
jgi:hypothetical protein